MLSFQQKTELYLCLLGAVVNVEEVYTFWVVFFFLMLQLPSLVSQEIVQYHHGDTLPVLEL